MANEKNVILDSLFSALGDGTRRAVIARLAEGPCSIKELAEPHGMALSSFLKHITVLARAGRATSTKRGRVRTCRLNSDAFRPAETWIASRRRATSSRLDTFASLMSGMRKPGESAGKGDERPA